jgi:transposase
MREDDGRKLSHATLEELRFRAVREILEGGAHPAEVARVLGLSRQAVYAWLCWYEAGGWEALKAKPVPGRPSKLAPGQLRRLYELVAGSDPRQLSFGVALWTRQIVQALIRREFGVELEVSSVGRVLRSLGLSPQRPLARAYEKDPAAVARWKTEVYPAIRAAAKREGSVVYFADEAGIRSDYHSGTTWAPRGHTPVVSGTGRRFSVNMISALTPGGTLRFTVHRGHVNANVFIEFCRKLLHDAAGRPVHLIVDGHKAHTARATQDFVASTKGQLTLHFLPGYSPELNPDEWVWKNIKHDRLGKTPTTSQTDLEAKVRSALHRLQALPRLLRAFLADPHLTYITT